MLSIEQLESRDCLSPIVFHGGDVLAHPAVANVYLGTPAGSLDQFTQALVSQYAPLLSPYGVGVGSMVASVALPDPGSISDSRVQQILASEIAAGVLPAPGGNSLYMVFLPRNTTDSWAANDSGWHSEFSYQGWKVPYAVVYQQADVEYPWNHEFAEAVTNPQANSPGSPSGWWAEPSPVGGEICDLYPWLTFPLGGFNFAEFALPDGSMYQARAEDLPFVSPKQQQIQQQQQIFQWIDGLNVVLSVAHEEFAALSFRVLSLFDPAGFSESAAQAQDVLANDGRVDTLPGRIGIAIGEVAFARAISRAA